MKSVEFFRKGIDVKSPKVFFLYQITSRHLDDRDVSKLPLISRLFCDDGRPIIRAVNRLQYHSFT